MNQARTTADKPDAGWSLLFAAWLLVTGASGLTGLESVRTGDLLARHFSQPSRGLTDFVTSGR